MSKAVALYPYAVSGELELKLTDFDDPASERSVDVSELRFAASENNDEEAPRVMGYDVSSARTWRKLGFRIEAALADHELSRILPPTSSVENDARMVVLLTCTSTKFRHGVRLKHANGGRWSAVATIQREDVKGAVLLRPQLIRVTGIPASEELPFATSAGTTIAVGEPIYLHVDPQPSGGGILQSTVVISWEDFSNSDNAWRREHADDVFHLEPFLGEPRLYLNSRYAQLRDVMESTAKRGWEAVLRDMTAAMIAQPALFQLATVAISGLELDQDSGTVEAPSGWKHDLLASVLPRLYPEEPSEEDRLQRAALEIRESDGAASLMARLGSVIQEMTSSYKTLEAAVRIYESTREGVGSSDD